MAENVASPQASQAISRPVGVWILTIYALIFVGVVPLLLAIFVLISGNMAGNELSILYSIPINIGAIISAISAWKGNEKARRSLLILVTLHYVLVAINNYLLITSGQAPDEEQTRLWSRVLRGFVFPAVYIWYFNKYTTKQFYK